MERPAIFSDSLIAELRAIAASQLAKERRQVTLQPTALVNEAWLKLAGASSLAINDRTHALALAARAMRQILCDAARRQGAEKRGGGRAPVLIDLGDLAGHAPGIARVDAIALDEALARYAELDSRGGTVLELRFFGGLTWEAIGARVGVSSKTAEKEWQAARAWLLSELFPDADADHEAGEARRPGDP